MPGKNDKKAKAPVKSSAKKGAKATPSVQLLPAWPVLKPLLPPIDLELESRVQDQIFVVRKLFTASLCKKYVSFLAGLPLTTTPAQAKKGEALRVNDRFEILDPVFAELLFNSTGLKQLTTDSKYDWGGDVCGLNPRIRIYRYSKGQFFDKHYDDENVIEIASEPPVKVRTTWTLLLYLTGASTGCVGGETVFYLEANQLKQSTNSGDKESQVLSVAPEVGMALLHKHGNDCLLHEGRKVVSGEKWIIRSDLCVRV